MSRNPPNADLRNLYVAASVVTLIVLLVAYFLLPFKIFVVSVVAVIIMWLWFLTIALSKVFDHLDDLKRIIKPKIKEEEQCDKN